MKRSALLFLLAAGGCSLEERGQPADASVPTPDASFDTGANDVFIGLDGAVDAPPAEAGPCSSGTTCSAIPSPWRLVAFSLDPKAGCPTGWTTTDGVANPTAGAGACACNCAPTVPSCATTSVKIVDSSSANCAGTTDTLAYSGSCTNTGTTLSPYVKIDPILPTGGGCAPAAAADPSKVSLTAARTCAPPPACVGDLCTGSAPSTFAACIEHDQDVACDVPGYSNKTVIGAGTNLACNAGGCTCGAQTTCDAPLVEFFSQPNCQTKSTGIVPDGACHQPTYTNGSSMQSLRVTTTPAVKCTPGGSATPMLPLTTPRTICCK